MVKQATADRTGVNGIDRQPDGTFAPGNRAAAGRSSKPAELRKALENAVSVESIQTLAESLLRQANLGDVSASKLLIDKLIPRIDVESEVRQRVEAWKNRFLDELLYCKNNQTLRERLGGYHSSANEETNSLLELLGNLESFQDEC